VTPTVVGASFGAPVVAVDPHTGGDGVPMVDSDNLGGAQLATEHLIGLGHRRIGFLAGRADLESARLRRLGYQRALSEAGIEFDPGLVRVGSYEEGASAQAARELLAVSDRPTAVFAANDLSAITTIDVALTLGLNVPADLSVIGFDNIPEGALMTPALTTIEQPIQLMGQRAIAMLVEMLRGGSLALTHVTLPTRLVVRQSCSAPQVSERRGGARGLAG
jgi:LacI family transcriptional regulator